MRVFEALNDLPNLPRSVLTVGTYDGFHRGHQSILEMMKQLANTRNLQTAVVTFDPHPRKVITGQSVPVLTTRNEKLSIFEKAQINEVFIIPFTKEFASYSAKIFIQDIIYKQLNATAMVIGYDHHFGKNREGSFENLQKFGEECGMEIHQAPPFLVNKKPISSSAIRAFVQTGEMEEAAALLGYNYTLIGTVVKGEGRGKTIGFPTANIQVDNDDKLLPQNGVYAIDAIVKKQSYKGMMNIGRRPTFDFTGLTLEAHLFNFSGLIYLEEIEIKFKKFIRPEQKFSDVVALRKQLEKDKENCKQL